MNPTRLNVTFAWGLVLVIDKGSKDEIPEWANDHEAVSAATNALMVRVLHGQEGPVSVSIEESGVSRLPKCIFDGELAVNSGILMVGDIPGEHILRIEVTPGVHALRIFADDGARAERIEIHVAPNSSFPVRALPGSGAQNPTGSTTAEPTL